MEKNSRKDVKKRIGKQKNTVFNVLANVFNGKKNNGKENELRGLKGKLEKRIRYSISSFEATRGRKATREERAKIRHRVTHDFQTRLAVRTGSLALAGFTLFSAGKMLGEGSGKIEGVTQENPESVTVDVNNFKEGLKVVGLGDDGVLLVQNEDGQDVQITNQNVNAIKEQNDIIAQREAQIQQIRDDIKNIKNEKDAIKYMKKTFREQYKIDNGVEIAGNIKIYTKSWDSNPNTKEEVIVEKASGEIIESWNERDNQDNSISKVLGILLETEKLRLYYQQNSPDSYMSRKGGEKDQLADFIIRAKGLDEQTQQVDGMEPGE